MSINVVDLFCGCGGFSSGFNNKKFNILFATDYDDVAIETYKSNFPKVCAMSMDIADVNHDFIRSKIGVNKIDVVIGGPPCGGMILHKNGGFVCAENELFLHFSRIVSELSPKIFVIENIEKVAKLYDGALKNEIISYFRKMGYITSNYVLCSEKFGVPQLKKRSIFIGIEKNIYYGDIHFSTFQKQVISAYDALSDLPTLCTKNIISNYVSEPINEYQKMMRFNVSQLSEHFLLSPSESLIVNRTNKERKIDISSPSPNIDTRKKYRDQMHYYEDRLLSIRELARLQSFPDSFIFFGTDEDKIRQIGNAIPPLLANVIANAIAEYLKKF